MFCFISAFGLESSPIDTVLLDSILLRMGERKINCSICLFVSRILCFETVFLGKSESRPTTTRDFRGKKGRKASKKAYGNNRNENCPQAMESAEQIVGDDTRWS
jgi:hypothetical protein